MSEAFNGYIDQEPRPLIPPLSRVATYTSPEERDRVLLRFIDIPYSKDNDVNFLVNAEFFNHFAFQLWNASQLKTRAVTRFYDPEHRGIWLISDKDESDIPITEQVAEIISQYEHSASDSQEKVDDRLKYIEHNITQYLEEISNL